MKQSNPPTQPPIGKAQWPWLLVVAGALLVLLALLVPRPRPTPGAVSGAPRASATSDTAMATRDRISPGPKLRSRTNPASKAEEVVAAKVVQFGRSRRQLVQDLAEHFQVKVPRDVERFFDAVERGHWEEIEAAHHALLMTRTNLNTPRDEVGLAQIWRPIQETWGAAREAQIWPAQKLLDYGNAILDSLRPGMVYIGGTDPGCFIPTMLNETSGGERHLVLTQNALADGTYLNYLAYLHHDRMTTLTQEDSQRAFQDYLQDAQRRLEHDQQFPRETKQVLPGEDIQIADGRIQVSGQVAVMAINERLVRALMEKNPDLSFAMETSFPMKSLYAEASTLGPIMEIGAKAGQNALTAERAQQAVDYWRSIVQQVASDPEAADSEAFRIVYSKLATEQAALLQDRQFTTEADQAYRSAVEIWPGSPDAVFRYADVLLNQNRVNDAISITAAAVAASPDNAQFRDLLQRLHAYSKR